MMEIEMGFEGGEAVRVCAREGTSPKVDHAFVVAFRSAVTDVLGECVGLPLAVIAATADPVRLRRKLSETWHAAWSVAPPSSVYPFRRADVEASDVRYEPLPFSLEMMACRPIPPGLTLEAGRLRVALPTGAVASDLDQFLCLALDDRRFDVVAQDPSSVRRRHAAGHAAELGPRYARRPGRPTVTLVRNVYAFRPDELPDLVSAVELAFHGLAVRCRAISPQAQVAAPSR